MDDVISNIIPEKITLYKMKKSIWLEQCQRKQLLKLYSPDRHQLCLDVNDLRFSWAERPRPTARAALSSTILKLSIKLEEGDDTSDIQIEGDKLDNFQQSQACNFCMYPVKVEEIFIAHLEDGSQPEECHRLIIRTREIKRKRLLLSQDNLT